MKKENEFDFLDPDPKKDDTTSSLLVSILFGKKLFRRCAGQTV